MREVGDGFLAGLKNLGSLGQRPQRSGMGGLQGERLSPAPRRCPWSDHGIFGTFSHSLEISNPLPPFLGHAETRKRRLKQILVLCLTAGLGEGQLGADCAGQCLEEPALADPTSAREIDIGYIKHKHLIWGFCFILGGFLLLSLYYPGEEETHFASHGRTRHP